MVEGQAHRKKRERRAGSVGAGALLALAVMLLPGWLAAEPCEPWPGEPAPLPRASDPDEMRALWATLRARELAATAQSLEQGAPIRAHGFWRRVLCLDPASEVAEAGLARTPLIALHAPAIVTAASNDGDADDSDGAWAGLSLPVLVRAPQPASPPPPRDDRKVDFRKALSELEQRVRAAQFESALEVAVRARRAAVALGDEADNGDAAQLEVLAATAELALGRSDAAAASFGRALEADPDLTLDSISTPPKVRRALERARKRRAQ